MSRYALHLDDVFRAQRRIAPFVNHTPVLTSRTLSQIAGRSLFFKCENFQRVGAFKFRGACNAVFCLSDDQAQGGVVTHSSGNHAQAIALAAAIRKIDAHVVMPETAPLVKREATKKYGATVHLCRPTLQDRQQMADEIVNRTGGAFVSSYNHPDVIAGQGTVAIEMFDQVPSLDAIIVPVSGGGLISGIAIATQSISPHTRIIAAEPTGADDVARSLAARELVRLEKPQSIADGLLATPGDLTWPIVRDHVERVITVDDEQIIEAMKLVWQRMKIIIEPSAATAFAAVLDDQFAKLDGIESVGVILSGGNVDLDRLYW